VNIKTDEIVIISSDGIGPADVERYHGARTKKAIRNKLSKARYHGRIEAFAWIRIGGTENITYGKLAPSLEETIGIRTIPASIIQDNPAAVLAHKGARK
jgi:hypothetical protein